MIRAIVTDIEGTTSSIRFVHDVLFPYARKHIAEFVREHATESQVAAYLNDVRREVGRELDLDGIIAQLIEWIDADRKVTPLKGLQGLIWEKGYQDGDFHGHVYADAYENLKQWHANGIALYVYSSGSVYAQKLLFGHTEYGDLTPLFSGYFDTKIGAKTDPASYQAIVTELRMPAVDIVFLSDVKAELDAAASVGMQTCWLVREGDIELNAPHTQVADFDSIKLN